MTNDFEKPPVIGAKIILQSWAEPTDVKPCSAVEHCEMPGSFVDNSFAGCLGPEVFTEERAGRISNA